MVHCAAVGCSNRTTTKREKKLSFFKFPADKVRREAWVRAVNRKNWSPSDYSFLCCDHFSEDQIISVPSGLLTYNGAIPNIFPAQPSHSMSTTTTQQLGLKRRAVNTSSSDTDEGRKKRVVKELNSSSDEPCTTSVPSSVNSSCCVPQCNAKGAHKFSVPKDGDLRRNWELKIGRTGDQALRENDVVCESHFLKSMVKVAYEKEEDGIFRGVKKLSEDAVPTVFLNPTIKRASATSEATQSSPSTSKQEAKPTAKNVKRPMKRKCCVPNCPSVENASTTLHQFPIQAARRKTWLNLLNMSDFKTTKFTRVCSKHFTPSSFTNPGELRADAVPKIYSSATKKAKQELDPDSLLSEAQKTAAWLQSVKQKREERKQKRLLGEALPTPKKYEKVPKNPWGVKDCDVCITKEERALADAALPHLTEEQMKGLNVPMPMIEVKQEPPEVFDLTADDAPDSDPLMEDVPLPPPPVKTNVTKPKSILPKIPPPTTVPSLIPGTNLLFQTTTHSGAELNAVQNQPLAPSTIYRVIIPTSVQGHTIETNSILQQLKEKISALHLEKVTKKTPWAQQPLLTNQATTSKLLSTPVTVKTQSSTPKTASSTPQKLGKAPVVKSNIIITEKVTTPSSGDHAYASKNNQNTTTWPILVQTPAVTPLAVPSTGAVVASTSSGIPSTTVTPSAPVNLEVPSFCSVAPPQPHVVVRSKTQTTKPTDTKNSGVVPPSGSVPTVYKLASSGIQINTHTSKPTDTISTVVTPLGNNIQTVNKQTTKPADVINTSVGPLSSGIQIVNSTTKPSDVTNPGAVPLSGSIPTIYIAQQGVMKVVPTLVKPVESSVPLQLLEKRSIAAQTVLENDSLLSLKQTSTLAKANDTYRRKIKLLKQNVRRLQNRLTKATAELEELKSLQTIINEEEKGKENIVIIEATDKCSCFQKQREHEDVGDILQSAVKRIVPSPQESRVQLIEHEKLLKRIGLIRKKLKQKEIIRVVVFQTEDLYSLN